MRETERERERDRDREREGFYREEGKSKRRRICASLGAGRSSEVRAFAHGAMGRRIDPSWGGPIELFLVLHD